LAVPNFQELYDVFKDSVQGDTTTDLRDFSDGSILDAFAAVSASFGQRVTRRISREVNRAFVSSAQDKRLTTLVRDRYGIEREAGETDDELRDRVYQWLEYNGASTLEAIRFFAAEWLDGAQSVTISEDYDGAAATVEVTTDSSTTVSDYEDAFDAQIDGWRPINVPVNREVT